jgi:hypothetical protein
MCGPSLVAEVHSVGQLYSGTDVFYGDGVGGCFSSQVSDNTRYFAMGPALSFDTFAILTPKTE